MRQLYARLELPDEKNKDDTTLSFRETLQLDKFKIAREELEDRKIEKVLRLCFAEILRTRIGDSRINTPVLYREHFISNIIKKRLFMIQNPFIIFVFVSVSTFRKYDGISRDWCRTSEAIARIE